MKTKTTPKKFLRQKTTKTTHLKFKVNNRNTKEGVKYVQS